MQFYYNFSYIPYPKSNRVVNDYIGCIRRLRAEPNLYRCSLCKERWDQGHDVKTLSENRRMHDFICSSTYFYSRYIQKATAIQATFKGYITRKKFNASRIIQQAVLKWLYRPEGPMMRKAERHFYSI